MSIDWQMTADMAAEELRTATESAIAMIEARLRNIADLEAINEQLRIKNAELKALAETLEESNRTAVARIAELEGRYARTPAGLHIAALEKRVDELEAECRELRGASGISGRTLELEREARIEKAHQRYLRRLELDTESEGEAARSAWQRSLRPGDPGYVDPFWPKERVTEWAER